MNHPDTFRAGIPRCWCPAGQSEEGISCPGLATCHFRFRVQGPACCGIRSLAVEAVPQDHHHRQHLRLWAAPQGGHEPSSAGHTGRSDAWAPPGRLTSAATAHWPPMLVGAGRPSKKQPRVVNSCARRGTLGAGPVPSPPALAKSSGLPAARPPRARSPAGAERFVASDSRGGGNRLVTS